MTSEVPDHGAELVVFVKTYPVIDGEEVVSIVFKKDVTTFAVGIVGEDIEEDNGAKHFFFFDSEVEVMMLDIVVDVLLQGTWAVGAILAIDGEGDDVKAERFAEVIGGDFAQGKRVVGEIPKRLLAFAWLVHGLVGFALVMHIHEEGVIAAKHELAFEFVFAVCEGGLDCLGILWGCHAGYGLQVTS